MSAFADCLAVLERDIRNGSRIVTLAHDFSQVMLVASQAQDVEPDEESEGPVVL